MGLGWRRGRDGLVPLTVEAETTHSGEVIEVVTHVFDVLFDRKGDRSTGVLVAVEKTAKSTQ